MGYAAIITPLHEYVLFEKALQNTILQSLNVNMILLPRVIDLKWLLK